MIPRIALSRAKQIEGRKQPRVVVLGGGYGGVYTVDLLTKTGSDFTSLATASADFSELLGALMEQRMSSGDIIGPP